MAAIVFVALVVVIQMNMWVPRWLVRRSERSVSRTRATATGRAPAIAATDPEVQLATSLIEGNLPRAAYQKAMEAIALAEERRSPLTVPLNGGDDVC